MLLDQLRQMNVLLNGIAEQFGASRLRVLVLWHAVKKLRKAMWIF